MTPNTCLACLAAIAGLSILSAWLTLRGPSFIRREPVERTSKPIVIDWYASRLRVFGRG